MSKKLLVTTLLAFGVLVVLAFSAKEASANDLEFNWIRWPGANGARIYPAPDRTTAAMRTLPNDNVLRSMVVSVRSGTRDFASGKLQDVGDVYNFTYDDVASCAPAPPPAPVGYHYRCNFHLGCTAGGILFGPLGDDGETRAWFRVKISTAKGLPFIGTTISRSIGFFKCTGAAGAVGRIPDAENMFLTRQGSKIPPATCLESADAAEFTQAIDPVTGSDKSGDPRSLGGFSFTVKYEQTKVCVELVPGAEAVNQGMQCVVQDSRTAPTLQGVATIHCVTEGKSVSPPFADEVFQLATIRVRPQPEAYSLVKPNNGNGQVTQLLNMQCKLTDRQGDPIAQDDTTCADGDVTMRYLEGDVEPDCMIDGLDTQAVAFRWGAPKGSLLYQDRFNLEPPNPADPTGFDNDIDVNDLQFVYGRLGSTCDNPQEEATPVNPKA